MKPMKQCNHAGCTRLVPYDQRYCSKHKQLGSKATYHKRMYQSDESKRVQFYQSTAWRKLSRRWLTSNPICQSCWQQGIIRKADVVDHIIELKDDWSRRLDETNLQSLCYKCHIEKTNKERAKRKNKI